MPQVGEIRKGEEIRGKRGIPADRRKRIWAICEICGRGRWSSLYRGKAKASNCKHCSDSINSGTARQFIKDNRCWRGWRNNKRIFRGGYIGIKITNDDFFYPMVNQRLMDGGYVPEHRLIMAQHLGRCLAPFEVVHHKNGIRDDNRLENLELSTTNAHSKDHSKGYRDGYLKGFQDGKGKRIEELEARIRELEGKWN